MYSNQVSASLVEIPATGESWTQDRVFVRYVRYTDNWYPVVSPSWTAVPF